MGTFLQKLLGSSEPLFASTLHTLERTVGADTIDARLIGDITHKAHDVIRRLGLDPSDSSAKEVYMAINAKVRDAEFREFLLDKDFVLLIVDGELVSFNLIDIVENAHHELSFDDRMFSHGRRALRGEIVERYVSHPNTNNELTMSLASEAGLVADEDAFHDRLKAINDTGESMHEANSKPYILAVGDIISDDFIDMTMGNIKVKKDDEGYEWAAMELGAKIPYEGAVRVDAVECSPNAAVSMSRLGLSTGLMSWIGDDDIGRDMVTYLKQQNVDTDSIVVEDGMKSNFHYVLRYGADRTKLQRFEDYSYQWQQPSRKPDWLYLGVLGEKTWPLHESILGYLEENPDIKLIFQPGMYHLMWGSEKLRAFYERAEIVIMNREEAAQVTGKERGDIKQLLDALHEMGAAVAVVTDGPDGAYASDGRMKFSMPNYPDPVEPYDRTGAGDAFASTITAALASGESLETALRWAPINSMSVVQKLGAQAGLIGRDELQKYLDEAPEWYHPKELE